jgi:hypothetical protein
MTHEQWETGAKVAVFVFDASAMVKRYLNEPGSAWIRGLASPAGANDIYLIKWLTRRHFLAGENTSGRKTTVASRRHSLPGNL